MATTNSKTPPVPPPKPKTYQLQYPHGQNVKFGQLSRTTPGGQLPQAPGDSDTDSGICADSDNQLSPRHVGGVAFLDNKSKKLQRKAEFLTYREHLTPESAWRVHGNSSASLCQRRLSQGLQASFIGQTSKNGKQYRVRFADQVSSTDGSTSSASGWDNNSAASANSASINYSHRPTTATSVLSISNLDQTVGGSSDVTNDTNDRSVMAPSVQQHGVINDHFGYSNRPLQQRPEQHERGTYALDGITSAPLPQSPPAYSVVMTRLRRNDDQRVTRSNDSSLRLIRRFHNRSSSLPRGMHCQSTALEVRRGSIDCSYPAYTEEDDVTFNRYLMRSADNVSNTEVSYDPRSFLSSGTRFTGRRLPELPADYAMYDVSNTQQIAFGRQRRIQKTGFTGRSQSVGRASSGTDSKLVKSYINEYFPSIHRTNIGTEYIGNEVNYFSLLLPFRAQLPSVRAQLIALDHRGLRIVLIEKLQPGPFGFYIATGVLNQKRGIFISRVSLPSLAPVLSVGDEIIYVEDELVKGEDLEYVQALIAGKSSVKIVLLPTVAPTAC
uniref:PDZ domain-containing protein n=1 Tax=Setaria digitata TaxID=48799 RepID=A0A915Q5L8_9BILA